MPDDARSWSAIEVTVDADAAEAIEYLFNQLDSPGTEINHLGMKSSDLTTVIGYFTALPDDDAFQEELRYALKVYGFDMENVHRVEGKQIENADWLSEWKKHWSPTVIGRFVIAPPWSEIDEPTKIIIRIEPNMAFGTGTHETTQLCIHAIEKYFDADQSFLDVGTGTGILAIAAAKIDPHVQPYMVACDTDADSVAIARENAASNGVGDRIEFYVGSIDDNTPQFDFVTANLTVDVIVPLLPLLIDKTRQILLLSGILADQEEGIITALRRAHIYQTEIDRRGEWISVVAHTTRTS